jgi:hypothetical protein
VLRLMNARPGAPRPGLHDGPVRGAVIGPVTQHTSKAGH